MAFDPNIPVLPGPPVTGAGGQGGWVRRNLANSPPCPDHPNVSLRVIGGGGLPWQCPIDGKQYSEGAIAVQAMMIWPGWFWYGPPNSAQGGHRAQAPPPY